MWFNPDLMTVEAPYTVTNGPKKIGHNNGVTVLKRVSLQENVWSFLLGSRKAGFHCTEKQSVTHKNRNLINKKEFHREKDCT